FYEGGHSICRNAILQKMFIAIGRGEHLGSGADVIGKGWKENGWPEPEIKEHFGAHTDRVELTLRLGTVSVLNPESKESGKETSKETSKENIKSLMREDKFITIRQIAQKLQMSEGGVEKAIRILRKNGEIIRNGGRFGGEWIVLK
nr:HTH domain-containing protein [Bacteroidales bacterium]